jgi:hypothetical protein
MYSKDGSIRKLPKESILIEKSDDWRVKIYIYSAITFGVIPFSLYLKPNYL